MKLENIWVIIFIFILGSCRHVDGEFKNLPETNISRIKLVLGRVVYVDDSVVQGAVAGLSDGQLIKLKRSDIPTLRLLAYKGLLQIHANDSLIIFKEILSDTSAICTYDYERGVNVSKVADVLLSELDVYGSGIYDSLVALVFERKEYLRFTYDNIYRIDTIERYYDVIKLLAQRKIPTNQFGTIWYADIEKALYGLSRYKRKEDIPFIKEMLMNHMHQIGIASFNAITVSESNQYEEVLNRFFKHHFCQTLVQKRDHYLIGAFIGACLSFPSRRNYQILDDILNQRNECNCSGSRDDVLREMNGWLNSNKSEMYSPLLKELQKKNLGN